MFQERRQHPRAWWPFSVQYHRAESAGGAWRAGAMVNVSTGGLRFTCSEPLTPGTRVCFELLIAPKQGPYAVEGTVIWGRTIDRKVYEYGVAFADLAPEQQCQVGELVDFLNREPLQLPEPDEQR